MHPNALLLQGTAIPSSSNAEKLIHKKVDLVTNSHVGAPPEDDLIQVQKYCVCPFAFVASSALLLNLGVLDLTK